MTAITSKTFTPTSLSGFPHGAALLASLTELIVRPLSLLLKAIRIQRDAGLGDAESVRHYARQFERTDPGFAADLYAAADRGERQRN
jgi:hypothetical protein